MTMCHSGILRVFCGSRSFDGNFVCITVNFLLSELLNCRVIISNGMVTWERVSQ